jgi:hypothetical protein
MILLIGRPGLTRAGNDCPGPVENVDVAALARRDHPCRAMPSGWPE